MSNRYIYTEDNGRWVVELLSDKTDKKGYRKIRLECIKELQPSPIFGSIRIGAQWSSGCLKGHEGAVGWTLTPCGDEHAAN